MGDHKDIRFSEKRVDESYKEHADKEKGSQAEKSVSRELPANPARELKTSKPFFDLITSLGYQCMMLMGDIRQADEVTSETNPEAAKQIIDLLIVLRVKTSGNTSAEEKQLLDSLIPELQMKYSSLV